MYKRHRSTALTNAYETNAEHCAFESQSLPHAFPHPCEPVHVYVPSPFVYEAINLFSSQPLRLLPVIGPEHPFAWEDAVNSHDCAYTIRGFGSGVDGH